MPTADSTATPQNSPTDPATPEAAKSNHKYDAFISYSRKNQQFAATLERALESYKPPKDFKAPQRHLDIFRDVSDFSAGAYGRNLDGHLKDSAKLIVVCSPEARGSQYVDDEIRRFVELRGVDHVIPVLISGVPNNEAVPGREEEMAFPRALCEAMEMPLAVDYLGFDPRRDRVDRGAFLSAWHSILSKIFELDRGEVEQREKRRRARARRITYGVLGAAIVVLSVLLIYAVRQQWIAQEQRGIAQEQLRRARQMLYVANLGRAQQTLEGGDLRLGQELLAGLYGEREFRGAEWLFLWAAYHDELTTFRGHRNEVRKVAFSPDGRLLATAGWSKSSGRGEVRLWDAATRREVWTFSARESEVVCLAFSPDGRTVATGGNSGRWRYWDVTSKQETGATEVLVSPYVSGEQMSFSPDGKTVAFNARGGGVALRDVETGRTLAELAGDGTRLETVLFSPDGKTVAVADGGGVKLWNAASGRAASAPKPEGQIRALAFSHDGKLLAVAAGGGLLVFDTSARAEKYAFPAEGPYATCLAFSPDGGRLVVGRRDGRVELWEVASWRLAAVLRGHSDEIISVAFSHDGALLLTGSRDNSAKLWHATPRPNPALVEWHAGTTASGLAVSPDGGKFAVGVGARVEIWDASRVQKVSVLDADSRVESVAFSPDGRTIAAGAGLGGLRLWDVASGRELLTVKDDLFFSSRVAFSPDGKTVVGCAVDGVKFWDVTSGREVWKIEEWHESTLGRRREDRREEIARVALSPDGKTVATTSNASTMFWDVASRRVAAELPHGEGGGSSMAFSPDGRLLALGRRGLLMLWDVASRQMLQPLRGHGASESTASLAFSPDGKLLAASGLTDGSVKLWDVASMQEVLTLRSGLSIMHDIAFSPDGRTLLVLGETARRGPALYMWRAASEDEVRAQLNIAE